MADRLTREQRRKNMQNIKSKNTSIEMKLRRALWAAGVRYRTNVKTVFGSPDIAIKKYKIAVFCDSSFFHGRNYDKTKHPETNKEFWEKKIKRNIERDIEVNTRLQKEGWRVLRFWDIEINKNLDNCVCSIITELEKAKKIKSLYKSV